MEQGAHVGNTTSYADGVGVLQAQSETRQLSPKAPCFPQNEGQGLVELVPPKWGGVEFLVNGLDKELIQLIDR